MSGPGLFRFVGLAIAAVIALAILPLVKGDKLPRKKRRPLNFEAPVEPLTGSPVVRQAAMAQRQVRPQIIAWNLVVAAVIVISFALADLPVRSLAGVPFIVPLIVVVTSLVLMVSAWHFFRVAKNTAAVDAKSATIVKNAQGHGTVVIHAYLTSCSFRRQNLFNAHGKVQLGSAQLPKPIVISLQTWQLPNLVNALAILAAEGRFAPEKVVGGSLEARRDWLVDFFAALELASGKQLSTALRDRLMRGPLMRPDQFSSSPNLLGLAEYHYRGTRAWWEASDLG
ncbi:MAG: hypothetical protein Q4P06_02325 [Actinomycetaceae bacterium]|nr:hypothetical protein [Actinomycetaceae bacterium]